MRNVVIMNEAHSLLSEQEKILKEKFKRYEFLYIPKNGWSKEDQQRIAKQLVNEGGNIIFISPVPVLLGLIAFYKGYGQAGIETGQPFMGCDINLFLFHNDHRQKKELPDGRIIQVVASTGWQLMQIGGEK